MDHRNRLGACLVDSEMHKPLPTWLSKQHAVIKRKPTDVRLFQISLVNTSWCHQDFLIVQANAYISISRGQPAPLVQSPTDFCDEERSISRSKTRHGYKLTLGSSG